MRKHLRVKKYRNIFSAKIVSRMKFRSILFGFTFLLFAPNCKKDGKNKINARSITSTDKLGNLIGTADPTDWRFDDQWSNEVLALLDFADTVNRAGLLQADTVSAIAYPNPAADVIGFTFATNRSTLIKMVIVDENLHPLVNYYQKLIRSGQSFAFLNVQFDLTSNGFSSGNYYRIYYALYSESGLYKRGHGDFKRN
jgi:hypothetical protein